MAALGGSPGAGPEGESTGATAATPKGHHPVLLPQGPLGKEVTAPQAGTPQDLPCAASLQVLLSQGQALRPT